MSSPSRVQQKSYFRTPIYLRKNPSLLPPITVKIRPLDPYIEPIPTPASLARIRSDVKYVTPNDDNCDFWVKLRQHLANEPTVHSEHRGNQQTLNKVVRIFVSSTFTDFFNEREMLIKHVGKLIISIVSILHEISFLYLQTKPKHHKKT
jgi:hypothetical protein